jgi:hypothetical protein
MLEAVIMFLIWLLVLGLVFWLVVWVLGLLGIPIPPRVVQIVGAIIFLILLLYFVQAVMGGHLPRFGRL